MDLSIVRVVRVIHFLLQTSYYFQMTCPWTSKKFRCYIVYIKKKPYNIYIKISVKIIQ